jgi:starch synthase (maltosyl-transferring)
MTRKSAKGTETTFRERHAGATASLAKRVAIENVAPAVDGGLWPAKRVQGETVDVFADIFSDGHEALAADLLWRAGDGPWSRAPMRHIENDCWTGAFAPRDIGAHTFAIEAWRDPFASWAADVDAKLRAQQNVELETAEGARLVRAAQAAAAQSLPSFSTKEPDAILAILLREETRATMRACGPREGETRSADYPLSVDRQRAAFSAWYEMFPRSASNDPHRHGAFRDVIAGLDRIAGLGFDVLYFPPIHPIGRTNRKGRDNALVARADDPGSVYAIGDFSGGHESIHPELGTLDDFRALVAEAGARGLEIALDFAIQCSPDHPWIRDHPDWFSWRPDGSLRFAENPPKKYEDIVNIRFDGPALPAAWHAWRDVLSFWIAQGVRIFRVDNPHTKPLPFWRWLIAQINHAHPDVIFLSEAFTRPKMMKRLAKIGFQQSYTYFTWRNGKQEIIDYLQELGGPMRDYFRPNFFVNTPDINPYYLQTSGRPGFIVRATLAATLSPNWGVYSGFELCEAAATPGREEYLHSEKYEIKARDFDTPLSIAPHISRLNAIRRAHVALQAPGPVLFLNAWSDHVLAYARLAPDRSEAIVVMANLDPHQRHSCAYEAPLWEFGLPDNAFVEAEDLLYGGRFRLHGKIHQIALDPPHNPVVIWRLINPAGEQAR